MKMDTVMVIKMDTTITIGVREIITAIIIIDTITSIMIHGSMVTMAIQIDGIDLVEVGTLDGIQEEAGMAVILGAILLMVGAIVILHFMGIILGMHLATMVAIMVVVSMADIIMASMATTIMAEAITAEATMETEVSLMAETPTAAIIMADI